MAELEVYLQGGSPWGFRLQGGKEFRLPLKIAKINPGGKADIGGVTVGDHVREINGVSTDPMYHAEAMNAVKKSQYSLSLVLSRSDEDDTTNVIQSIGISPEDTSTRVSLKIGRKTPTSSAPSSPKSSRRVSETIVPQTMLMDESIPHGQGYMKRLLGSQEDLLSLNDESARNTKHNIFVRGKSVDPSYFNDVCIAYCYWLVSANCAGREILFLTHLLLECKLCKECLMSQGCRNFLDSVDIPP